MYLVVRKYRIAEGKKQEISKSINDGFVPLITKMNGFMDYYCLCPDERTLISVSVFKDQKGADESVKAAADWVGKNLAKYFPEKPEILSGEVFARGRGGESGLKKAV